MKKTSEHYVNNVHFFEALVAYKAEVVKAKRAGIEVPQVPEYLGECIIQIANNLSSKANFVNYCVDSATEALTPEGWKSYDMLSMTDMLLSLNLTTGDMVWDSMKDLYINENYNDKMFRLTNQGVDALVTPTHKFVVNNELVPVEKLKERTHITIMGLPNKESVGGAVYEDAFVELVGWYVTEGTAQKYHKKKNGQDSFYLSFCQKEGPKADRIRRCLATLGIVGTERSPKHNQVLSWRIPSPWKELIMGVAPNKVITPFFVISLPPNQRALLINTMIAGDGWTIKSSARMYCQKNKNHIDTFVMLCALAGISTRVSTYKLKSGDTMHNVHLYEKKTVSVSRTNFYGATRPAGGDPKLTSRIPIDNYKGVVWCPQTNHGNFVCRRNGYVYVTGNTYRDDMILDAIENCLTYLGNFDPEKSKNPFAYFTQISYYAFLRRIAKEKKHQDTRTNLLLNMDIDGLSLQEGDQADHNFVLSAIQMINESYVKDGNIVRPKILKRPKYLDEIDPDDDHEESMETENEQ